MQFPTHPSMALLQHPNRFFFLCNPQTSEQLSSFCNVRLTKKSNGRRKRKVQCINSSVATPPFPILQQPPQIGESTSETEQADLDFYKIGVARSFRAYGSEFKQGPDGFGVFAAKDVESFCRSRIVMEIPLELMLTISKNPPWVFFPDIIPVGHPVLDIINSTNPETDWDLRLACLLLFARDLEGNFWQLYSDFLPSVDSLVPAKEEDLASTMQEQHLRVFEFWKKNSHSAAPLNIKRLAPEPERLVWAVSIAQSLCINFQIRVGALVQDAHMLIPYADMLNHSSKPSCFFHWRLKDRMLEVMINAGQTIKKGEEMTINYMIGEDDMLIHRYKSSSVVNPWGRSKINLLPTWSDGSHEECQEMLRNIPTTLNEDNKILDSMQNSRTLEEVIKYVDGATTATTVVSLPPKPPPPPPRRGRLLDEDDNNNKNKNNNNNKDDFREKALYLDSIGIDSLSILSRDPSSVSSASLPELKLLCEYLSSLGLSTSDLSRLTSMCPKILSLSLREAASVCSFLIREARVPPSSLRRVLHRRPRLLISPVSSRLRPTLYFLHSLGIHDVTKHTDLLSCSVEDKFLPRIDYFTNKLGFSYRDSVSMFRRFPPLFCYSLEHNFDPKFNYFVVEMGRELKELREFPQYFSFSLVKRIMPRHQVCVNNGVYFPLNVMLKTTEDEFRRRLRLSVDSSLPIKDSPLWSTNMSCEDDNTVLQLENNVL